MRRTAAAAALVVVLACAGCEGGAASPGESPPAMADTAASSSALRTGPPVPPVPGIAAEVVEYRSDRAVGGRVSVAVTDTGEEPFSVTAVALDSPGFTPLPAVPATASFVPGRRFDLRTPYGAPVCDTAAEPAAARLTVERPGGVVAEVRVPLAAEVLRGIHARLCAAVAVERVVDVAVVDLAADGDAVTGRLVLARSDDDAEAVTVTRVQGNVLYDADAQLPLDLAVGDPEASTGIVFTTARCDPHALAETQQPYLMLLGVRVADGAETVLDLPLDDAQRELLHELTDRVCTPA
ncbi:hypothetical protein [Trujillonella endophytica]|uniref:Lipoprotein n=1 Tax=Trujillonella endophytica TaxID=673521 RepID=A0A1H8UII9_9ACTN|nr:hypothetical protein [Trujillella endophytica]SEP02753.1 hypothetical protein SAMN05660991_02926 [Trujillella endophytica]